MTSLEARYNEEAPPNMTFDDWVLMKRPKRAAPKCGSFYRQHNEKDHRQGSSKESPWHHRISLNDRQNKFMRTARCRMSKKIRLAIKRQKININPLIQAMEENPSRVIRATMASGKITYRVAHASNIQ